MSDVRKDVKECKQMSNAFHNIVVQVMGEFTAPSYIPLTYMRTVWQMLNTTNLQIYMCVNNEGCSQCFFCF